MSMVLLYVKMPPPPYNLVHCLQQATGGHEISAKAVQNMLDRLIRQATPSRHNTFGGTPTILPSSRSFCNSSLLEILPKKKNIFIKLSDLKGFSQ